MINNRRQFIQSTFALAGGLIIPSKILAAANNSTTYNLEKLLLSANQSELSQKYRAHKIEQITGYNNFYEYSLDKEDVAQKFAQSGVNPFGIDDWKVKISGECAAPGDYTIADIIKLAPIEERKFNMRCVEGWSKVVTWNGFALNELLKLVKPNANARFVEFLTYYDKKAMPTSLFAGIDFPYIEGLRLDEAMHPLTTLVLGIDKKPLLPQNGAPLRIVIPWKYGFKGAKSIAEIRLVKDQPVSTWEKIQSSEYGFYGNVNPKVSHPRWSQSRERVLGSLYSRPTLMFNGFDKEVAALYAGMDLAKFY